MGDLELAHVWRIGAIGVGMFALRISGFALRDVAIPPRWERALGFAPIAVLSGLVASSFVNRSSDTFAGVIAAVGAGVIAYRTRRMWACIVSGVAFYAVLRQL